MNIFFHSKKKPSEVIKQKNIASKNTILVAVWWIELRERNQLISYFYIKLKDDEVSNYDHGNQIN